MTMLTDPADTTRYLDGLNACFGQWGGAPEWTWAFERDAGAGPATRLVVRENDDWIAGSGISWRGVATHDGAPGQVGIMTGSWTLPAARGKGCFTRFVRASAQATAARNADCLLAFVTENNASRRRLEAAGATMIPTVYCRTVDASARGAHAAPPLTQLPITAQVIARLHTLHQAMSTRGTRFDYATPEQLADQLLRRPTKTTVWHHEERDALLVFEHAPDTERLLFAAAPQDDPRADATFWANTARWASQRDRKFFGFAIHPAHLAAVQASKLDRIDGFMTVNAPNAADVDPGPGNERWAGPWDLQSGDRM